MNLVPSLVLDLARAKGITVDALKHYYGVKPSEMGCLRGLPCGTCQLCPQGRDDGAHLQDLR